MKLSIKHIWVVIFILFPFCIEAQSKAVERTGDVLQYALPSAAGLSTLIYDDGTKPVMQFARSFIATTVVTYSLKFAVDKKRPTGGARAFPSGHTAAAFCGAAFIHKRYGPKYGIPAFVLSGFVGWSRVDADKHDWIDVTAGALIGTSLSLLNTKRYHISEKEIDLSFFGDRIYLSLRF